MEASVHGTPPGRDGVRAPAKQEGATGAQLPDRTDSRDGHRGNANGNRTPGRTSEGRGRASRSARSGRRGSDRGSESRRRRQDLGGDQIPWKDRAYTDQQWPMNATDSTKDESPEVEATDTRPLAPATARTPYRPGEGREIAWNRRAMTPTCSRGQPRGRRSGPAREGRTAGRGRGVRTRRQTRRKEGEPKQPSGLDRTSARGNSSEARGRRACSEDARARQVANRRKRHAGRTRGETRRTEVRSSHEAMSGEAEVPRERRTREGEERGPGEARTHDCSTSRARP
jgi:hypothetical protein